MLLASRNCAAKDGIANASRRKQAMLYLTTLALLLVVVDSIHALGSSATR
jgi:hypothetical protein